MLFSSRRSDDADVIRARLRALLADGADRRGWLPDDVLDGELDDAPVDAPDAAPGGPPGPRQRPGARPAPGRDVHPDLDDGDDDSWTVDLVADPADPDHPGDPGAPDDADARHRPAAGSGRGRPSGAGVPASRGSGRHRSAGAATRVDPGPHGARTLWLVAVLAALAVAGWSWATRPEVSPAPATGAVDAVDAAAPAVPAASTGRPAESSDADPAQIVVAVVGQVVSPGLVTLPAGARVADALAAAGGLLPEADPAAVNAAALLVDGQQVAVGVPGASAGAAGPAPGGGTGAGGLVDLNTAGLADLDALPGIGPVLAQRILDHRSEHGPFASVEQLDEVSGIGPALYAEIAPLVTV